MPLCGPRLDLHKLIGEAERGLCKKRGKAGSSGPAPHDDLLAIVTWIETTCNRRRHQRALGKLTPVEFKMIYATAEAA